MTPSVDKLLSLIVPTYNRAEALVECLAHVAQLVYPRERFEVIVVDDGSDPPVDTALEPIRRQIEIRLCRQPNGGPSRARNHGAEVARGRFLAFIDDDCWPRTDWLQTIMAKFESTPECIVGGRTVNTLIDNPFCRASQSIHDVVYRYYNADAERANLLTSNNLALPRELLTAIGGFDESFVLAGAEDRDLCDRWRAGGYSMMYVPEAVVQHAHPLTLRGFCRQHFNYGRGAWRFHRLRASRGSGTLRQEMSFHADLGNWLLRPFRDVRARQAPGHLALLVLWQLANAAGYFYEARVGSRAP